MFKSIVSRGWYPALITAIAVLSLIYYDDLSINIMIPVLVVVLCIGLIVSVINARQSQLEKQSVRLTQLATYFNRRFLGNSSQTIFTVIDNLFSIENPQVWEWARGCEMTHHIFDSWSDHFSTRVETDLRNRRYDNFLHTHINELWALNNHYYDFTEQFCEIVDRFEVPKDVIEQYNRFITEYNAFVESFRNAIMELKTIARTQIEAPSVKLARELPAAR